MAARPGLRRSVGLSVTHQSVTLAGWASASKRPALMCYLHVSAASSHATRLSDEASPWKRSSDYACIF